MSSTKWQPSCLYLNVLSPPSMMQTCINELGHYGLSQFGKKKRKSLWEKLPSDCFLGLFHVNIKDKIVLILLWKITLILLRLRLAAFPEIEVRIRQSSFQFSLRI